MVRVLYLSTVCSNSLRSSVYYYDASGIAPHECSAPTVCAMSLVVEEALGPVWPTVPPRLSFTVI
jgi:hypothetical protein